MNEWYKSDPEYAEALKYVIRHSEVYGLEDECVAMFHKFCEAEPYDNLWRHANDALHEWDI